MITMSWLDLLTIVLSCLAVGINISVLIWRVYDRR